MKPLRIGTRGSKLALWQAEHVRAKLREETDVESEIVVIKTAGDRFASSGISEIGAKGVFIKEIEEALLSGQIDIAVHSMKDVPTDFCSACRISIGFAREDSRDCLISRKGETLAKLRPGARVGTSSVRRASQLRAFRPDLEIVPLRGNVDTRLRKLDAAEYDAVVVAKAGIERLGLSPRITEILAHEIMLPAPGQGALGIEFCADQENLYKPFLEKLEDWPTVCSVRCERALQDELQGGCTIPLGAWARIENSQMKLDARVLNVEGTESIHRQAVGSPEASEHIGRDLARRLLDAGADRLLRIAGRIAGGG
ncbi:MAG TPA: hydroxymethylbilane synthase [Candidatus Acidoferrales bacterium]|nr:hydroxymethylbilane synthase [Candidatus Acidoferrales bacterium]